MSAVVLVAALLGTLGLVLLLVALRARRARGFGPGETVALDDLTLFSARHGLVGRPDRVVRRGSAYIPEEWKSARRVGHGHRLQLGVYFILLEERYGTRPPYGVVVLGDGTRVTVPNTAALRAEVLAVAARVRAQRRKLTEPVPVSQPENKCRACGQRANCDRASA